MPERIKKVNELIKRELARILLKEIDLSRDILITITDVDTFANLIESRISISVLPENKTKEVMALLNKQIYDIQQKLNKILFMRPVPKIVFVEDTKAAETQRIDRALEKIKEK